MIFVLSMKTTNKISFIFSHKITKRYILSLGVSGNQKIGITRLDDSSSSMASASSSARKSSGTIARRQSTQDGADLEVGSVVEVLINNTPCYGVIRWIGEIPEARGKLVAGIEMVTLIIQ